MKQLWQMRSVRRWRPVLDRRVWAVLAVVLFAGIGSLWLVSSRAATPTVAYEVETGTKTTATTVSDTTASGGQAVKFGAASTGGTFSFAHPGIGMSRAQLDFVKAKIAANQEPWTAEYKKMTTSGTSSGGQKFFSKTYTPHPVSTLACATAGGVAYLAEHPELGYTGGEGCNDQTDDALAAYTLSLLWYFTGDAGYAQAATRIMNAWSGTLTKILYDEPRKADGGFIFGNGKLQAAWTGETITRAAEIIRYTYTPAAGQETFDATRFGTMLRNILLPLTIDNHGGCCANWQTSTTDATIAIGIFLNDKAIFDNGIGDWRAQLPAAFYMTTDVPKYPQLAGYPIPLPNSGYDRSTVTAASITSYWINPGKFVNGLGQETCRDMGHLNMGLEAAMNAAETAYIQGIDLYGEQQARLVAAMEFNAQVSVEALANMVSSSEGKVPSYPWLCGDGKVTAPSMRLGWEQGYNHYVNRKGLSLPYSKKIVDAMRPSGAGLHMVWSTLKANNP